MKRYVGVDLHKNQFTVYVEREEGDGGYFKKYPSTEKGYETFIREVNEARSRGEKTRIAVESTGNTRYFKNRLE